MNFTALDYNFEVHMGSISQLNILDSLTDSSENGILSVIAARPGMGKTNFMLQLALDYALFKNKRVYIFSPKDSSEEFLCRIEGFLSGLTDSVRKKNILPIYVCKKHLKINDLEKIINEDIKDGIVFIDSLEDIESPGYRRTTAKLKAVAQNCNLPIIATARLPRPPIGRDKKPLLSDAKYLSLADNVILLYRRVYCLDDINSEMNLDKGEIIIAKAQNEEPKTLEFKWNGNSLNIVN